MLVYRISKRSFAGDLNGIGARLYGGRWNSVGISMLYTASSRSLAILEILVHTTHNFIPDEMEMVAISIPDNSTMKEISTEMVANEIKKYGNDVRLNAIG